MRSERAALSVLAQEYRDALQSAHTARTVLTRALVRAQADGVKVQELMDQTGYSRRRIQQLLADGRKNKA